jgi:hypothetical protein
VVLVWGENYIEEFQRNSRKRVPELKIFGSIKDIIATLDKKTLPRPAIFMIADAIGSIPDNSSAPHFHGEIAASWNGNFHYFWGTCVGAAEIAARYGKDPFITNSLAICSFSEEYENYLEENSLYDAYAYAGGVVNGRGYYLSAKDIHPFEFLKHGPAHFPYVGEGNGN